MGTDREEATHISRGDIANRQRGDLTGKTMDSSGIVMFSHNMVRMFTTMVGMFTPSLSTTDFQKTFKGGHITPCSR